MVPQLVPYMDWSARAAKDEPIAHWGWPLAAISAHAIGHNRGTDRNDI
jgi:hypothetical protein